jgi:hypothetical protein
MASNRKGDESLAMETENEIDMAADCGRRAFKANH